MSGIGHCVITVCAAGVAFGGKSRKPGRASIAVLKRCHPKTLFRPRPVACQGSALSQIAALSQGLLLPAVESPCATENSSQGKFLGLVSVRVAKNNCVIETGSACEDTCSAETRYDAENPSLVWLV